MYVIKRFYIIIFYIHFRYAIYEYIERQTTTLSFTITLLLPINVYQYKFFVNILQLHKAHRIWYLSNIYPNATYLCIVDNWYVVA